MSTVPSLATTAAAFETDIAAEKPVPSSAAEALGRITFVDPNTNDIGAAVGSLNSAAATACGINVFTSSEVDSITQDGPKRTGAAVGNVNGSYGACGQNQETSAGYLSEARSVTFCGSEVVVTSMLTGAVLTFSTGADPISASTTGFHLIAWMTAVVTPAVGLKPPVWTIKAFLLDPGTGKTTVIPIPTPAPNSVPAQSGTVNIEAAGSSDSFVIATTGDGSNAVTDRIVSPAGAVTATYQEAQTNQTAPLKNGQSVVGPVELISSLEGPTPSQTFDGFTGKLATIPGLDNNSSSIVGDGGCGTRSLLLVRGTVDSTYSPNYSFVVTNRATVRAPYRDLPTAGNIIGVVKAGVIQDQTDASGNTVLALVSATTGKTVWTLGSKQIQVDSSSLVLGLLVLTNNSNAKVLVDPATGKEATGVSATAQDLLIGNDAQSGWFPVPNGKSVDYLTSGSSSSTEILTPADGVCR